ncbi:hypothetical protein SHIRM173S_01674 [Streptomyces hirsutus]
MRIPGAVAARRTTAGTTTWAIPVAKEATVTVPAAPAPYAASSAAARSSWARTTLVWPSRISPAGVSRTPLAPRSTSRWPVSCSSAASCWDTADGVRYSAAAAAVTVRWSATARRMWSRRASIMESILSNTPARPTRATPTGRARGQVASGPAQASSSARAATKASTARFTSSVECAADSWTRIRACPSGTTG